MNLLMLGKLALKTENINEAVFKSCDGKYRADVYLISGNRLIYEFNNREDYNKHLRLFEKEGIKVEKQEDL